MSGPVEMPGDYDSYHDNKKYHLAKLFNQRGGVSPLCAKKPRTLNLARELWTIRPEAVTCKKCLAILAEQAAEQPKENRA